MRAPAKGIASVVVFAAGLSVAVVPSLGANTDVSALPSASFSPSTVTVATGDSVTWSNSGGTHNVKFDDGLFEQPADPSGPPWTVSRTFDNAGSFRYQCAFHGAGMSGTVVVNPPSSTGTTPTGGGGGSGGGGGTAPPAPVTVFKDTTKPQVKLSAGTQRILAKKGLTVTIRVDEASTITASASINVPGASRVLKLRKVTRKIDASGPTKLKLGYSGKTRAALKSALARKGRLKAKVTIVAKDAAGNSRTSKRTVTVK